MTAQNRIDQYQLQPHPEGGYYTRTYCAEQVFSGDAANDPFPAGRPWSTAILYLMEAGDFAAFHRIKSDEIWHFHEGGGVELYLLRKSGQLDVIRMGPEDQQQVTIPAHHWFAAAPIENAGFTLVGCTVCPGFMFQDHEMAIAAELRTQFPNHAEFIDRYCRS
jgi:predicted cupin superfamily sugar epimerase